jgi:hypothetical protein
MNKIHREPAEPYRLEATTTFIDSEDTGSHYVFLDETTGIITVGNMQTVIQTPTLVAGAKVAGLDDAELADIAATMAANPLVGDIIPGTGGARKVRSGGKGKGKSGVYRVITYYAAEDVPVFLLALVDKG